MRQLTEDFIIPQDYLTLLVKIGEGEVANHTHHCSTQDTHTYYMLCKLSTGEFGIVYKARLSGHNGMNEIVAVKTLKGSYNQCYRVCDVFNCDFTRCVQSGRS